jgi:hypothetical protein
MLENDCLSHPARCSLLKFPAFEKARAQNIGVVEHHSSLSLIVHPFGTTPIC